LFWVLQETTSQPKLKQQPLPRGKKGKLKKMQKKYRHQDEEERRIAMELLAVQFSTIFQFFILF
jgi:hypothetical protein